MELGRKLKELRISKNLNQSDLAKILKVDRSTYGKYETGDSSPDFEKLIKLANYFKVPIDDLFSRGEIYDVGTAIKEERKFQGMTERELGELTGVSEETITQYEEDDIPIKQELADRIADIFGMTFSALLHKYDLYNGHIPLQFNGDVDKYEAFKKAEERDAFNENHTLAAHHDGEEWTDEELEEIKRFKEFVKSRRQQKGE
jgi:transcriptional regulator with XRE-family HTH domain